MTKNTALKIQAICTLIVVLVFGGTVGWFIWKGSDTKSAFGKKIEEKVLRKDSLFNLTKLSFDDFDLEHLVMEEGICIPVEGMKDLEFDWPVGQVEIRQGKGTDLVIREGAKDVLDQKHKMVWKLENGLLKIQCFDPDLIKRNPMEKRPLKLLVLEVPKDLAQKWNSLSGSGASADMYIYDMKVNTLELRSASGDISLNGVKANKGALETISGDMDFQGVQGENFRVSTTSGDGNLGDIKSSDLTLSSVSGDMESRGAVVKNLLVFSTSGDLEWKGTADAVKVSGVSSQMEVEILGKRPQKCHIETVSGDIHLTVSGKESLTISKGKLSGEFESNIPLLEQTDAAIVFQTVSGDIEITGK